MTIDDLNKKPLDTIMEQQAETRVNDDRDNLLYLMGFNDGVIQLFLKLQEESDKE